MNATTIHPPEPDPTSTEVVFRLHYSGAQQVFVIGLFNNWSTTATPMRRTGADHWETSVMLPPGNHDYTYFVINQSWFSQPTEMVTASPTSVLSTGTVVCESGDRRIVAGEAVPGHSF